MSGDLPPLLVDPAAQGFHLSLRSPDKAVPAEPRVAISHGGKGFEPGLEVRLCGPRLDIRSVVVLCPAFTDECRISLICFGQADLVGKPRRFGRVHLLDGG